MCDKKILFKQYLTYMYMGRPMIDGMENWLFDVYESNEIKIDNQIN